MRKWSHCCRVVVGTGIVLALVFILSACGGGGGKDPTVAPVIAANATTFELKRGGASQFLLPVKIGEQTLNLLVDSGSNALLVFADRLDPDNSAVQITGTPVSKGYSSTVRSGRLAVAPVQIGAYGSAAMRIMLIDQPQSWNDPSLTAKHADGVIGLRRTEGLTQRLDSVPLDVPLAALQPAISAFELDLPASGRATLSFGIMPILDRVDSQYLFAAKTLSITDTIDKIQRSYSDLQIPFRIRSRLGVAQDGDLDILLDTGATSKLVLDTKVAESLGYDPRSGSWALAGGEEIELNLIGPRGTIPLLPKFRVDEIKVSPLRTQGVEFEAVLGIDRWQGYVIGFSSVDYQAGGPDGTISMLDRRVLQSALATPAPRNEQNYIDLPGLNSLGDDRYASADDSGRTIVFQSNRSGGKGNWDVYVYRQGEGILDLPELNSSGDDSDPTISGDGKVIAFHSNRIQSQGGFDLFLFDLETRTFLPTPDLNTPFLERTPSLSRDGRYVSFRSEGRPDNQGKSDIYLYDRSTAALVPLAGLNTAQHQTDPSISGDGRYLAFDARMNRVPSDKSIYLYDVANQRNIPLSEGLYTAHGDGINSTYEEQAPAISADGQWLAFHSNRSDSLMGLYNRDLVVAQVKTGLVFKMTGLNSEFDEAAPAFSGDGRKLLFHSSRPGGVGGADIYMFDLAAALAIDATPDLVSLPAERIVLSHLDDGRFSLPVTLAGRPSQLLLDTGSSAVVLFSDRLPATAYALLGESVSVQLPAGLLVGELARIDVTLDERLAKGMTCIVAKSSDYPDSAAHLPDGVSGVWGLRFKRAAGEVTSTTGLDVPLAVLQPAVNLLELNLAPDGPAGLSLGSVPVIGAVPTDQLFNSYIQGKISQDNSLQMSFTDLEPGFLAQSSLGLKSFEWNTLLLSSVLTDRVILDQTLAANLGFDLVRQDWGGAEWIDLYLVGTSSVSPRPVRCPIDRIDVHDLSSQDYAAILNLERWQPYVVGFDFVDYQAGGQNGVASFILRSEVSAELLTQSQGTDRHFVPLPGLNSLGDDAYGDISDDGRIIVFQSNRLDGAGKRDVLVYEVGRGLRVVPGLNTEADEGDPSVSADGRLVAFHSDRSGDFDIYLYDLVAKRYIDLPGLNSPSLDRNADISADGTRIAFRSQRPQSRCGSSDIYLYDIPTAAFVSLPDPWMNTCAHEVDPSLNADGSMMSFNATSREDSQGNRDVYLYDVAKKSLLDFWFVNSKVLDTATSLSSDGNFIAFNSERNHPELASRGRDIFLMDLRSDEFIFLPGLNSDFEDSAPALSRDGRNLLFHSKRPGSLGGYDLYLYRRD